MNFRPLLLALPLLAAALDGHHGADVIKLLITGGVNSRIGAGLGAQMFEDEARAVVETSRMYGKKVAVHARGVGGQGWRGLPPLTAGATLSDTLEAHGP